MSATTIMAIIGIAIAFIVGMWQAFRSDYLRDKRIEGFIRNRIIDLLKLSPQPLSASEIYQKVKSEMSIKPDLKLIEKLLGKMVKISTIKRYSDDKYGLPR